MRVIILFILHVAKALEKRLLTLEQETLQNNLLFEKFIRRLDEQFEITKNVDLSALKVSIFILKRAVLTQNESHSTIFFSFKNDAHFAALAISSRLAEENAPPMPSFSEV